MSSFVALANFVPGWELLSNLSDGTCGYGSLFPAVVVDVWGCWTVPGAVRGSVCVDAVGGTSVCVVSNWDWPDGVLIECLLYVLVCDDSGVPVECPDNIDAHCHSHVYSPGCRSL